MNHTEDILALATWLAAGAAVLVGAAEWLHARRCRRLGRLAFGPGSQPRSIICLRNGKNPLAQPRPIRSATEHEKSAHEGIPAASGQEQDGLRVRHKPHPGTR